jgi:hypothetical protein
MSYERMKKAEAELVAKVEAILKAAEAADANEDAQYGKNRFGDELPEELLRAETRLERIRALRAELEAEAKAQVEDHSVRNNDDDDEPSASGSSALPEHQIPTDAEGKPTPKAQRNFTDGDSRIMKSTEGFIQGWNCQVAVDAEHQVIVAQADTNQPPDVEHLVPQLEQVRDNCGRAPVKTLADAGYYSAANVDAAIAMGSDPYVATGRTKAGEAPPPMRGPLPVDATPKQRMARKLATKAGAREYSRRKAIVEPVFGQIKSARGLRSFLLRGLDRYGTDSFLTLLLKEIPDTPGPLHKDMPDTPIRGHRHCAACPGKRRIR